MKLSDTLGWMIQYNKKIIHYYWRNGKSICSAFENKKLKQLNPFKDDYTRCKRCQRILDTYKDLNNFPKPTPKYVGLNT